jgi:hypothetical protein
VELLLTWVELLLRWVELQMTWGAVLLRWLELLVRWVELLLLCGTWSTVRLHTIHGAKDLPAHLRHREAHLDVRDEKWTSWLQCMKTVTSQRELAVSQS